MDRDLAFRKLLVALPIILANGICTVDGLIWLFSENPRHAETGKRLKLAQPVVHDASQPSSAGPPRRSILNILAPSIWPAYPAVSTNSSPPNP